jgi:hypothetical protein
MLCLECGAEMRCSSGRRHHDVRIRLRASYVAVLGLPDGRTADDVHSREDTAPNSADGAEPNYDPNAAGGADPNGAADPNGYSGTD